MASTSISKAERSYIQAGILANPPSRADGRSLYDFRNIALETGVAPLANGSARLSIGRNPHDGSGGTEVLAAAKLEVESIGDGGEGVEGGRISCTVSWYAEFFWVAMVVFCSLSCSFSCKVVPLLLILTSRQTRWTIYNMT